MNRLEFQQLAEERLRAAEALLAARLWSSAYYVAGYAVECGLKSCIFARVEREGVLFDDRRFLERCWTHDLKDLIKLADLEVVRGADVQSNPVLRQNWETAVTWNETSRYKFWTEAHARSLVEAIAEPTHGVMTWIRIRW